MFIFWLCITAMTLIALSSLLIPLWFQSGNTFQSARFKTISSVAGGMGFVVLALGLYLYLGMSKAVSHQQKAQQDATLVAQEIKQLGSVQNIITTLEQKVLAHPDSRGFQLLGNLYLKTQQFKKAEMAFSNANELKPHQSETLLGYAESIYGEKGELTAEAKKALDEALKLKPDFIEALYLVAMDAYNHHDYATAIQKFEQILPHLEQGSEIYKTTLQLIAEAQKKIK